jgi:hypothetical protein
VRLTAWNATSFKSPLRRFILGWRSHASEEGYTRRTLPIGINSYHTAGDSRGDVNARLPSTLGRKMTALRWRKLIDKIAVLPGPGSLADKTCVVAVELLQGATASVSIVIEGNFSPFASASALAVTLDETQFQLGDGPVFEGQGDAIPTVTEDTSSHLARIAWPAFSMVLDENHIRSIAHFPLRIGAANLGSLTVYRDQPGALSSEQYADGLVLGSLALQEVVDSLAGRLSSSGAQPHPPSLVSDSAMHIAAGMVAESLNCTIVAAMVRIRAHAFATGRPVTSVAMDIIQHELVLEP